MHTSESPSCAWDIATRGPPHTERPLSLGRTSVCGDASEGRGDIGLALAQSPSRAVCHITLEGEALAATHK